MDEYVDKRALFVCLGNSCRSPVVEGVFRHIVNKMGKGHEWEVDSCGLADWNSGHPPSARGVEVMKKHGIRYHGVARQITLEDFNKFDYIFGVDEENVNNLHKIAPANCKAKIFLLGDFDPTGEKDIKDPYYDTDRRGFDKCFEQTTRSIKGFLEQLETNNIK